MVFTPLVLMALLGLTTLFDRQLPERWISRCCQVAISFGLLASLAILGVLLAHGEYQKLIEIGEWVRLPQYEFRVEFLFDRLSIPMAVLSFVLCGTISAFAARYLHREPGFNRFHFLFSMFLAGMILASVSANIEILFAGWEMVGLSSALLVSFFHERSAPARNALRVWTIYRISDAALLVAAVVMHHLKGHGDFAKIFGTGWPNGNSTIDSGEAIVLGGLFVIAAMGKSALGPFSGWLPRAMEGPTPSSAVFYGALSVHLGVFLLLRVDSLIEQSLILKGSLIFLGLWTALSADIIGRAQTDIKSALAYASLTQVGLIVVEVGCGWRYLAIVHMLGHACLRTLQFLRAPTFLQDSRQLENAIGSRPIREGAPFGKWLSHKQNRWLYRVAIERGYYDSFLDNYGARPFLWLFNSCDRLEQRWADFLAGRTNTSASRPYVDVPPPNDPRENPTN